MNESLMLLAFTSVLFLPQVLEALQAIRKTNNQPHLNLVN